MSCTVELGQQRVNEDGELKDGDGGCCVMEKFCYINELLFAHPSSVEMQCDVLMHNRLTVGSAGTS